MTDLGALLTAIAKEHLHIETLETRNSDSLDFHEVSVWGVKAALEFAFEAGKAAAKTKPNYENSKHKILIDLLSRPEGATVAQMVEATGWRKNSVSVALSTVLRKKWNIDITCTRAVGKDPVYRIDANALPVQPSPGRPSINPPKCIGA